MEVKKCVFCHYNETIKHLFFQCHFARSIWPVIQVASTLFPPCSITNILPPFQNIRCLSFVKQVYPDIFLVCGFTRIYTLKDV
jgi:hypothetical protein